MQRLSLGLCLLVLVSACGPEPAPTDVGRAASSWTGHQDPDERVAVYVVLHGEPAVAALPRDMPVSSPVSVDRVRARLGELASLRAAVRPTLEARGAVIIGELARLANAFVVLAPRGEIVSLGRVPGVARVELVPLLEPSLTSAVPLVGGPDVWANTTGFHGEGIRIGIVDTGIDYLHADLGGSGVPAEYVANDRTIIEQGTFPTARVIGGWDFAGDAYDANNGATNTPAPDPDPLDCGIFANNTIYGGHGSHVSGIAAGNGVLGDGTAFAGPYDQSTDPSQFRVFPGMAPRASLYALKVFGCSGSTGLLGLALERAADPDLNGNFDDRLDVVNASLGSPYGLGSPVNNQLIASLASLGGLFVAAAGNDDHVFFVTGSPANAPWALSVAASTDSNLIQLVVESPAAIAGAYPAAEGILTTPLAQTGPVSGMLVYADPEDGCVPLFNAAEVAGHLALVDRGGCPFIDKLTNVSTAGAVAAVVVDNELAAQPFAMGGGSPGSSSIPGVMILRTDGDIIKAHLEAGVTVRIERERYQGWNAELMTSFTSRGPSSVDSSIKPEITAPGAAIDSAAVATGVDPKSLQGTSMATPMVAGAAALLRQAQPNLDPLAVKAVLMNTAVQLDGEDDVRFPISMQGAGRLDTLGAVRSRAHLGSATDDGVVGISFGALSAAERRVESRDVRVTNTGGAPLTYAASAELGLPLAGVDLSIVPDSVSVAPGQSATLTVTLELEPAVMGAPAPGPHTASSQLDLPRHYLTELNGMLRLVEAGGTETLTLPVYAALRAAAHRQASDPFVCEQGAPGLFVPSGGTSAHPSPVVSAWELGTEDPVDVDPMVEPTSVPFDILAVGAASDVAVRSSFDEVSLHFGVVLAGDWTTPVRGDASAVAIHIDTTLDRVADYVIVARPYNDDEPFLDVLTAVTFRVEGFQLVALPTRRFLNLVPADAADTAPFNNSVIAFSVFAADLGLTEQANVINYRAATSIFGAGAVFDDTAWVNYDLDRAALDTVSGSSFHGKPLYTGEDPVVVHLGDDGTSNPPKLLLLHHTNVPAERFEVVDPVAKGTERVRLEHGLPSHAPAGRRLSSFVSVHNDGALPLRSAHLVGSIMGASLDIAAPEQGACAKGADIDCELGVIEPGASARVGLHLDALQGAPLDVQLTLTSRNGCITTLGHTLTTDAPPPLPPPLSSSGGCGCRAARGDRTPAGWLCLLAALAVRLGRKRKVELHTFHKLCYLCGPGAEGPNDAGRGIAMKRQVSSLAQKGVAVAALLAVAACGGAEPAAPPTPYEGRPPLAEPPAHVVGGFEAVLPETVLAPGDEVLPCWIIPLELTGPSRLVGGAKLTTGYGLHHGNVTSRPKTTGEGLRPCSEEDNMSGSQALDIVKGGGWLFANSTGVSGEEWQTFPEGHAYRIKDGFELVAHMHYLNTTAQEVRIAPRYEWFTVEESSVVHVMSPFGFIYAGFEIPPLSTHTVTGNCDLPKPFQIVHLMPHMHKLGTEFAVSFLGGERDGERFLSSRGYDPDASVVRHYQPPVDLSVAEGMRFSCTWENTFDKTIVEGIGDNEMCMLVGYGYPEDSVYMGFAVDPEGQCGTVAVPSGP